MGNKSDSTWKTYDFEDRFEGTSLKKRAEKRTARQIGPRMWHVEGEPKMGDAYPEYIVKLPEGAEKYHCTCYDHGQGNIRRRKMCSHVLCVILYRKANPEPIRVEEPADIEYSTKIDKDTEPILAFPIVVDDDPTARGDDAAGPEGEASGRFKSVSANTLPDEPLDMRDEAFGQPPIPDKFTEFRPNQWDAIVEIMEHLENGVKVVMLSAPTGSGKTIIGESVQRLMPGKSAYCCTTKSLQDQIQREFEYARTIKGRSNYPTQNRRDLTAEDCQGTSNNSYECQWCEERQSCPYQVAKEDAAAAPLPILNIAYFLAETKNSMASKYHGRPLIIIDEADTLEEQLMSSIEVVIGAYLRKSIGVTTLPKKTVPGDWARWLEDEIIPGIKTRQSRLRMEARNLFGESVEKKRQVKKLQALLDRIAPLLKEQDDGSRRIDDGWVMTGYENPKDKTPTIRFKPIRVDLHAHDVLWERGKQFLLMSATLISPAQMASDLGLEEDEWEVVHLDSTFPVENRPVFVPAVASMTNKTKAEAWPKMAEAIEKTIKDNPNTRILVHTVSYMLTKYLKDNITSPRTMMYLNSKEREGVLEDFLNMPDSVLLAPSFERGIDLPEEDCEIIIIAKVPYPYLGDKQVSARMYGKGGQAWYAVQTIRAIAQMTGRGMRSKDDWCDTYIMDAQFKRLFRENKRLFPKWWRDSLVLSMGDPKNKPMVKAMRERKAKR